MNEGAPKDFSKIGDPNFFGVEEAMTYCISSGNSRDKVFARADVQAFLKTASIKVAMDWGARSDRWDVWKMILSRTDLSFKDILDCAEREHSSAVWQIVLEMPEMQNYLNDLSAEEAVAYAKKSEKEAVKEFIYLRPDVQEYMKTQ